ncbi:RNB domain-containing ribonuclease [Luteimonas sp. 50]|uniref:RNB domain-containing ribonuclease n=1 Tax=Cognatiluteimonas sedimenti TaxID=2927791 RepID=A0ABT0A1Y4_9GAMM|nr:RNB domain-containing ribonuclease [Lysobacter sedimenti]MCJ0825000.1 RNB domain-containing ribonuclease [Lysobacter sedimenti]
MATTRRIHVRAPSEPALEPGIEAIKRELELPLAFPPDVEAAAAAAAAHPRLPAEDRSDLAFVTIDPPGAMDLDQALHVARKGDGYVVHYAIADVAAFVRPGDPVDLEANRRGATLYGADAKIPLHPKVLSEGAASLLPGQLRPALLWTIELDRSGEGITVDVHRALVRSRERFDYDGVQRRIDAGDADPMWAVLREIGELRKQREQRRGGVSLPLPEQEIRVEGDCWQLEFRARHPVEDWNEQISLLTGMAAAHLMMEHRVGLLRTLPEPDPRALGRLRRTAKALGIAWPERMGYPDFIRSLDPADPRHVAMMVSCTSVLRGAGYAAFVGEMPTQPLHSALASTYAHVTAPLRRLVDRYTGETCVALCAGQPVPDWVLQALPGLPATMADADRRAGRFERAVIDLAESLVLATRVGESFTGTIVEVERRDRDEGVVMLHALAIEAHVVAEGTLPLGETVTVRLVAADPAARRVRFELAA